jgi:UPF0755 protein
MKAITKWLLAFTLATCLLATILFTWYIVRVNQVITLTEPVNIEIPAGGTEATARALQEAGIINSPWAFIIHATLTGQRAELKAGTYHISGHVNIPAVINIISQQTALQNEVVITLLEGWSTEQMGDELAKQLPFTSAQYVQAAKAKQAEGRLFPDTYRFFIDATPEQVVETQLDNFKTKYTAEMKAAAKLNDRTVDQIVILASIVEKEARTITDKGLVAGVFWKRIDAGKRLESDVTLNYITGKNSTFVPLSDTEIDSPYNTYRNAGLPPGPISNPGYDALYAATYPTESNYWYFLATPDGQMKYAETYEQHLVYKNQYYP